MTTNNSINNLIDKALRTTSLEEIAALITSPYMLVRRALAKNSNTPATFINTLCTDPVLNVSYVAINNPKSTVSRDFGDSLPSCVTCKVDERKLDCEKCDTKNIHRF